MMGGGRPWFNMAKTAQMAFMKNLALKPELVRDGITFNTVAPGCIMIPDTGWEEEQKKDPNAFQNMLNQKFPLGRMGTPEEVANIVVFLCSPKSGLVNGASILVDGGESAVFWKEQIMKKFKIGLVKVNNIFSGSYYLPLLVGLIQAHFQKH